MEQEQGAVIKNTTPNSISSGASNQLLKVSKVFSILSRSDALIVLSIARHGMKADAATHSRIGLTRKQYYTRVRQLKNAGLIRKEGNIYFQTSMGSFLEQTCIKPVAHALEHKNQMFMIDVLKRQGLLSTEDLTNMLAACTMSK